MVAARRRSASSGPLRGLQRHVRRRARSCVQSNLPAMPTIGEGGLIPPISGQSRRRPTPVVEGLARLARVWDKARAALAFFVTVFSVHPEGPVTARLCDLATLLIGVIPRLWRRQSMTA